MKRLRGTLRRDRGGTAQPLSVLPAVIRHAPVAQDETGDEFVQRILDIGASAWIGTTDQPILRLLASAWDEHATLRSAVMGDPPDGLEGKALLSWFVSSRKDLRDLEKQITTWLSLLGLTPTDRSRLGVAEVKARTKLEELRARRESRAGRRVG